MMGLFDIVQGNGPTVKLGDVVVWHQAERDVR